MITYSKIDGWLKRPEVQQGFTACFIAACIGMALAYPWHLLDRSIEQTDKAMRTANYWRQETERWQNYSNRVLKESYYLLPGGKDGIQCDVTRCWNIHTNATVVLSSTTRLCNQGVSQCDAEKCWAVCTGEPAMEVRPPGTCRVVDMHGNVSFSRTCAGRTD